MLRSCKYCGKIHDTKIECSKKPKRRKLNTTQDKFRWTRGWQNKREEIRKRDKYMCQVCIRLLYPYGARQYNTERIEVHHIVSLADDYDKRIDDSNLITICEHHHEMAERGAISKNELFRIVEEQSIPPT